ncbi:MAG TPA: glycosyltransferase [Solirubrobacteraceae bacterium]|nr:glycosyltransferase [Solirubrobacteraceae bacterium]
MSKTIHQDRRTQAVGVALLAATAWFLPWLIAHADLSKPWLSIPFLLASLVVASAMLVSVVNRWQRAEPIRALVPLGEEPRVAVVIPTLGEPLVLLERTVRSVLDQDWPLQQLRVVVSDDGHDDNVQELVNTLALEYSAATLRYHRPPRVGDPRRNGDAKAGNLNSALAMVPASIDFVETRDADDLVGDPRFLRETVGQLLAHERIAFVQTIKTGDVAPGDPFDNHQPHFFRCAMLSRYAANAVFPCGSGVVWRREALKEIGDFPTWNLVEDLQSGLEALRLGWESCYLPIEGAHAQHSPEDLPNFIKQRGTWALDTVRLNLWVSKDGLSFRQRLQFYELALFYLQGPATLVFLCSPILGFLFHWYPVVTNTNDFILHFWPFAAMLELFLVLVHRPMSFEQLWRARLVWAGLSFVYARACILAITGGRDGKPRYVVTRKQNEHAWHWRQAAPQIVLLSALGGSMAWSLAHHGLLNSFDIGSAYWAVLYGLLLAGFVRLSWHGVPLFGRLRSLGRTTAGAQLAGAHVAGAQLAGAQPAGAQLAGAHVAGAQLAGAHAGVAPQALLPAAQSMLPTQPMLPAQSLLPSARRPASTIVGSTSVSASMALHEAPATDGALRLSEDQALPLGAQRGISTTL